MRHINNFCGVPKRGALGGSRKVYVEKIMLSSLLALDMCGVPDALPQEGCEMSNSLCINPARGIMLFLHRKDIT